METILSSPYLYAIIVTIAAFIAAYGSHKTNKKISKTYDEVIRVQKETIATKDDIIGFLTGGESVPRIAISKNAFYFVVDGSYSIPNLKYEIYYLLNYHKISKKYTQAYLKGRNESVMIRKIFECENQVFSSQTTIELNNNKIRDFLLETNKSHGFDIYFSTPYKKWVQQIRFKFLHNKWEYVCFLKELVVTKKTNVFSGAYKDISFKCTEHFPDLFKVEDCVNYSLRCFYNNYKGMVPVNRIFKVDKKNIVPPFEIN